MRLPNVLTLASILTLLPSLAAPLARGEAANDHEREEPIKALLGSYAGKGGLLGLGDCKVDLKVDPDERGQLRVEADGDGGGLLNSAFARLDQAKVSAALTLGQQGVTATDRECNGLYCSGPTTEKTIILAWNKDGLSSFALHGDVYFYIPNDKVLVGTTDYLCHDLVRTK